MTKAKIQMNLEGCRKTARMVNTTVKLAIAGRLTVDQALSAGAKLSAIQAITKKEIAEVKGFIEDAAGWFDESLITQTSPITKLPDGSACMTALMPLPKTHWLYAKRLPRSAGEPWLSCGTARDRFTIEIANHPRRVLEKIISDAARHAIRAATANGTQMDFDPDALVQNLIVELLGFNTPDGLSRVDKPAKAKRKAKKS